MREWVFSNTIGREFCHASREEVTKLNRKLNQEDILSIIISEGIYVGGVRTGIEEVVERL